MLSKPKNLSEAGKRAHKTILQILEKNKTLETGGCKAFYSPKEWQERGEKYGQKAELIIVHDGGDLAQYFNVDYENVAAQKKMETALEKQNLYAESCTCWYTAIYRTES
jgi:hypothetical protein